MKSKSWPLANATPTYLVFRRMIPEKEELWPSFVCALRPLADLETSYYVLIRLAGFRRHVRLWMHTEGQGRVDSGGGEKKVLKKG